MHVYTRVLGKQGSISLKATITSPMQGIHYVRNSLFPTVVCDIILQNGAVHLYASSFPFHLLYSLLYLVQACQQKGTLQSPARISTQCHRVGVWCPEKALPDTATGTRIQLLSPPVGDTSSVSLVVRDNRCTVLYCAPYRGR